MAVDVETYQGKLALFQVSDGVDTQMVRTKDLTVDFVKDVFDRSVLGFNFQFDLAAVAHWAGCFITPKEMLDIKMAFHLKHPRKPASLEKVCNYYGVKINKEQQTSDWSGELNEEQLEYAARDCEALFELRPNFLNIFEVPYYRLEAKFVVTCAYMQFCGIPVVGAKEMAASLRSRFKEIEVLFLDGLFNRPVNHNSHKDIKLCFETKHNIMLPGTDVEELRTVMISCSVSAREDLQAILRKRNIEKSMQYLVSLEKLKGPDGRVHPQYNPLVRSASGRSSCKQPNVQNPPGSAAKSKVRSVFQMEEGFYYFDLPNAHARVAAELSKDRQLTKAFNEEMDLHSITGSWISKLFGDHVDYDRFVATKGTDTHVRHIRDVAKNVFYGCLNGQGVNGLRFSLVKGGIFLEDVVLQELLKDTRRLYCEMVEYIKHLGNSRMLSFIDGFRINTSDMLYNDKIAITWLHYEAVFMKYILNSVREKFGSSVEINNFMHDSAMFSTQVPQHVFEFSLQESYGQVMSWFFKDVKWPALEIKRTKEMPL